MSIIRFPFIRTLSITLFFTLIIEVLVPLVAFAGINGPTQPEFSNFESVTTKDMVNEFTGAFTYNIPIITIPGPNGSSYPLSLSYHSGSTPDDDASWVGYGWTLNPGSILRQKRGFPDDYKSTDVIYWNNTRDNITIGEFDKINLESFSIDKVPPPIGPAERLADIPPLNYNRSQFYNNYSGYSYQTSIGCGLGEYGNLSLSWDQKDDLKFHYDYSLRNLLSALNWDEIFKNDVSWWKSMLQKEYSRATSISLTGNASNYIRVMAGKTQFPTNTVQSSGYEITFIPTLHFTSDIEWLGLNFDSRSEWALSSTNFFRSVISTSDKSVEKAYGYMYSGDVSDNKSMMDYFIEKDDAFNLRDNYLGVPFSNADNFIVTGEGIQGGFRVFNHMPGQFRPNEKTSVVKKEEIGVNIKATDVSPYFVGFGVNYANGKHTTSIKKWNEKSDNNSNYEHKFAGLKDGSDAYSFRFYNDPGGYFTYFDNQTLLDPLSDISGNASLKESGGSNACYPFFTKNPDLDWDSKKQMQKIKGKSSNISFNLFNELINDKFESTIITPHEEENISVVQNQTAIDKLSVFSSYEIAGVSGDRISNFSVVNKDGLKYTYGLPVFNRNEKTMNYSITNDGSITGRQGNLLIYSERVPKEKSPEFVTGYEMDAPYTGTFLLTSITGPDYIDITGDGVSNDDIGQWILFKYERTAGSENKTDKEPGKCWDIPDGNNYSQNDWYKWRKPYNGLYYSRNSLSEKYDDQGSFSSGEKEIYYLKSIETKTHIAYFVNNKSDILVEINNADIHITGSQNERNDGYEAMFYEKKAAGMTDANTKLKNNEQNENKLRYLERIELWSKDINDLTIKEKTSLSKKLQVTNFNYDYSIWPNQPNTYYENNNLAQSGKLTLKKVWTDYEDVKDYYSYPYEFEYNYNHYGYPTKYSSLDYIANSLNDKPNYNPACIDRWGNYRDETDALNRLQNDVPWVNQIPSQNFDPAAWQLKRIILPSKGEIHVQYEQNEYSFVQDRPAMVMANILKYNDPYYPYRFYVDPAVFWKEYYDSPNNRNILLAFLQNYFFKNGIPQNPKEGRQLYFKMLYSLAGSPDKSGNLLDNCNSEYITGYAYVYDLNIIENPTTIGGTDLIYFELAQPPFTEFRPRYLCQDYVLSKRNGIYKYNEPCNCDRMNGAGVSSQDETPELMQKRLNDAASSSVDRDDLCKEIDYNHSYLKLPLPPLKPKKGGGIRVKRLLMFDRFNSIVTKGDDPEEPALYGTEYIYKDPNGFCSGVATNEPDLGREENPIIGIYKKRDNQSFFDVYFSGRDLEQFEGPFGESILSPPSIGYSSIYIKNIYNGKTNPGYVHKTFHTCKDYPEIIPFENNSNQIPAMTNTNLSDNYSEPFIFPIETPFYTNIQNEFYMTQGYKFIKNMMHGKPYTFSTYGGQWLENNIPAPNNVRSSYVEYEYYPIGSKIPVMEGTNITKKPLGADVELISFSREVTDKQTKIFGDLDLEWMTAIFVPSGIVGYSKILDKINQHVTTKIISYQPFQKRQRTIDRDGIETVVENVAFDPYTGQPTLTKTYDGYNNKEIGYTIPENNYEIKHLHDGSYYNYNFLASHYYPEFGQMNNEKVSLKSSPSLVIHRRYSVTPASSFPSTLPPSNGNILTYNLFFSANDLSCLYNKDDPNGRQYCYLNPEIWYNDISYSLKKIFSKGDLLKITPSGSINIDGYTEYYHVKDIFSNFLVLVPYLNYHLPESDMLADVEIVRSGKSNQLNVSCGNLVTYGQEDENSTDDPKPPKLPIEAPAMLPPTISERQNLADALNNAIKAGIPNIGPNNYDKYVVPSIPFLDDNGNPASVKVLNIDGSCRTIYGPEINDFIKMNLYRMPDITTSRYGIELIVKRYNGKSGITFNINDPDPKLTDYDPLLTDLNNWLDRAYTLRLDQEIPEYDWFMESKGIPAVPYLTNGIDLDPDYQWAVAELSDPAIIKKIDDITGLTNLLNSKYFLKMNDFEGYFSGSRLFSKFKNDAGKEKYYYLIDRINKRAILAFDALKFNNFYSDNNVKIATLFDSFWIGVIRYGSSSGHMYQGRISDAYSKYFSNASSMIGTHAIQNQNRYYYYDHEESGYFDSKVIPDIAEYWFNYDASNQPIVGSSVYPFTKFFGYFKYEKEVNHYELIFKHNLGEGQFNLNANDRKVYVDNENFQFFNTALKEDECQVFYEICPSCMMYQPTDPDYNCCQHFFWINPAGELEFAPKLGQESFQTYEQYWSYMDYCIHNTPSKNVLSCFDFCKELYPIKMMEGVISASASTFRDEWRDDINNKGIEPFKEYNDFPPIQDFRYNFDDDYAYGNKGRLFMDSSFVFRSSTLRSIDTEPYDQGYSDSYAYQGGTAEIPFEFYNWKTPEARLMDPFQHPWLKTGNVTRISPEGNVLEEKNAIGIPTSAKYFKNSKLPILVANNSEYNSVYFESYENNNPSYTAYLDAIHHTGEKSYKLSDANLWTLSIDKPILSTRQVLDKGLVMKFWARNTYVNSSTNYNPDFSVDYGKPCISADIYSSLIKITPVPVTFEVVAQSGEWFLYEAVVDKGIFTIGLDNELNFKFYKSTNPVSLEYIYLDDIRIQPVDASMQCFVYDNDKLNLISSMDDNHFALLYQYNEEGKLKRKIKETVKGLKTITEANYNTPYEFLIKREPGSVVNPDNSNPNSFKVNNRVKSVKKKYKDNEQSTEFNILKYNLSPGNNQLEIFNNDGSKMDSVIKKFDFPQQLKSNVDSIGIHKTELDSTLKRNVNGGLNKVDNKINTMKKEGEIIGNQIKNSPKINKNDSSVLKEKLIESIDSNRVKKILKSNKTK